MFTIQVIEKDRTTVLKNLTEKDTIEILASAYDCIVKEYSYVAFKDLLTVNALDLVCFNVGIE